MFCSGGETQPRATRPDPTLRDRQPTRRRRGRKGIGHARPRCCGRLNSIRGRGAARGKSPTFSLPPPLTHTHTRTQTVIRTQTHTRAHIHAHSAHLGRQGKGGKLTAAAALASTSTCRKCFRPLVRMGPFFFESRAA